MLLFGGRLASRGRGDTSFRGCAKWSFLAAIGALLAVCNGCGSGNVRVSGAVTKRGQPLPGAEVVFQLEGDPEEMVFYGTAGTTGRYLLEGRGMDGLPPGKYQVTVTWYTQPDGKPLPAGEIGDSMKQSGRVKRHQSKFQREVGASQNFDLELTD